MCGIIALAKTHGTQNFFFLTVYAEKSFEKLISSHMQWQNIVWGCSQDNKQKAQNAICNVHGVSKKEIKMKYTKETQQDNHIKITITLDATDWQKALDEAYQKTKGQYKVQGFRQGKAPRKVIEKEYGDVTFFDEALNDSFGKYYAEILEKEKIDAVGNPKVNVEKLDGDGVVLTAVTAVYPKVKLGSYKVDVKKEEPKVTSAEVDKAVSEMQERSARMVKVEREAKNGDELLIDFVGKKDGVAFDGGTAKGYQLVLGSGTFIPGFEEQLVGTKAGQEKTLNVTFPKDYPAKDLADKPCTFDVKVTEIREKVLPKLDDDFAKNVSEFDTLEDYKKSLKEDLLKQKQKTIEQETEDKLVDGVVANAQVDIPTEMIDEQVEEYIHDLEHRLSHQGLKLDDYVKYMNTTIDKLRADSKKDAEKVVKTRLVLEAIIKDKNLILEKDEIEAEIAKQAKQSGVTVDDYKKTMGQESLNQMANNIVVDKLIALLKKENNL